MEEAERPVQVAPATLVEDHARILKAVESNPGDLAGPPCTRFGLPVSAFNPGSIRQTLWSQTGPDRGDAFIVEALIRYRGVGVAGVISHADLSTFNMALGEFVGLLGHVDQTAVTQLLGPNWSQVAALVRKAALCGELTRLRFDEDALATRHDATQKVADMQHTAEVAAAQNLAEAVQTAEYLVGPRSSLPNSGPGMCRAAVCARWAVRATVLRGLIQQDVYERMVEPWERIMFVLVGDGLADRYETRLA